MCSSRFSFPTAPRSPAPRRRSIRSPRSRQGRQRRPGDRHFRRLGARQQRDARQCRRRLCGAQGLERARRVCARCLAGLSQALDAVDARVIVLPPPPIQGIGNAGGFTMQVELRDGSTDLAKLQSITNTIVANAQSQSALQRVSTSFRAIAPQMRDRRRSRQGADAARLGRSGVLDAGDLFRLDLCRAVQQIRPRVSGLCAGRRAIPACGRATSRIFRCAISRAT